MWLLYLRFSNDSKYQTMHVVCYNKRETDFVLNLAQQRGFQPKDVLVEYARFYSRSTIKPIEVPNFHFHNIQTFAKEWGVTEIPVHV